MRSDMAKVIVERARTGGGRAKAGRSSKGRRVKDAEDEHDRLDSQPRKESMKARWQETGDHKQLNENLKPLYRFLHSNVGRPYDKVFSEICEHVKLSSGVQKHIRDHVEQYVEKHVEFDERGYVRLKQSSWRGHRWMLRVGELFVHPTNGLLCEVSKKQSNKPQSYKREKSDKPVTRWQLPDGNQLHQIDGIWCHVTLAPVPARYIQTVPVMIKGVAWRLREYMSNGFVHEPYYSKGIPRDAVFKGPITVAGLNRLQSIYGKPKMYGSKKYALSGKELKKHGLKNDEAA
jgi:hypothetical protein